MQIPMHRARAIIIVIDRPMKKQEHGKTILYAENGMFSKWQKLLNSTDTDRYKTTIIHHKVVLSFPMQTSLTGLKINTVY